MRTKFDGVCFRCHKSVKAGQGDIQHLRTVPKEVQKQHYGQPKSFVVRCFGCKGRGNVPLPKCDTAKCESGGTLLSKVN